MRNIYAQPKEDGAIMDSYRKIYKPKISKKLIYKIEDLFFSFVFNVGCYLDSQFLAYTKRVKNRVSDKYKGKLFETSFANDFTKTDPTITDLLTLDPTKERIYQTDDVKKIFGDLHLKTKGTYDKESFKWDLFGHLLKNKKNHLNMVEL
jgi:hypothetical protein